MGAGALKAHPLAHPNFTKERQMPFPLDPNSPGGPRRSEFVRASFAAAEPGEQEPVALAEVGGEPVAALGPRVGDAAVADPARAGAGA
jgi:hypothetical protein